MKLTQTTFYFFLQCACFCALFTILNIGLFYNAPTHISHTDHVLGERPPTIEEIYTRDSTIQEDDINILLASMVEALGIEHGASLPEGEEEGEAGHSSATSSPRFLSARAANERFELLCSYYTELCNKTLRVGEYTPQDRLMYQGILLYLISAVDQIGNNELSPALDYIKIQRGEEGRRGSATHNFVRMNVDQIASRTELWNVLTHEFGHIVDLGVITGYGPSKHPRFTEFGRKKRALNDPSIDYYEISRQAETIKTEGASYLDFVSGYAMKGIYEDFAESFNLYLNHYDKFKLLAQTNEQIKLKFDYMSALFSDSHLSSPKTTDQLQEINTRDRVWDTTKL